MKPDTITKKNKPWVMFRHWMRKVIEDEVKQYMSKHLLAIEDLIENTMRNHEEACHGEEED